MHPRKETLREYYANLYDRVHGSCSSRLLSGLTHRALEIGRNGQYPLILELGCGIGDHFRFIRSSYEKFIMTDITDRFSIQISFSRLPEGCIPEESGIFFSLANAEKLEYPSNTFDRIVVTCLLMHFSDPVPILLEWVRVYKVGGVLDVLIPNDFGIFINLYQQLVSNPKAKKLGINNLDYIRAIDHQSSPRRVLALIQNEIVDDAKVKIDSFPFRRISRLKPTAFWVLRVEKLNS